MKKIKIVFGAQIIFKFLRIHISLSRSGFATSTGTFEGINNLQNVSDGVANPVTLQSTVREVVYVEYRKDGMWVPAYVTNRIDDCYILYVPTSPNPTSGFTVMVHKSKIIKSNMNIEEVSSFVISVGVDYAKPEDVSAFYK